MEPLIMFDRILALFVLALVLGLPLGLIFLVTGQFLMDFVFFYPLFMSALWIAGGLYFWLHWERHWPWKEDTPEPPLGTLDQADDRGELASLNPADQGRAGPDTWVAGDGAPAPWIKPSSSCKPKTGAPRPHRISAPRNWRNG